MKIARTLGLAGTTLVLAGCGPAGPTALEKATQNCLQSGSKFFELSDGGKTVKLYTEGLQEDALTFDETKCVVKDAGAPDSVITKYDHTLVGAGTQTASWGNFDASWSLDGIHKSEMVIKQK